jgi:hypothetical protein
MDTFGYTADDSVIEFSKKGFDRDELGRFVDVLPWVV